MDQATHIEITGMANTLNDMATKYFATYRSDNTPFETTVNFYDENPAIAGLKASELRISLSEHYKPSRVHVSVQGTQYIIQIDRP